MNTQNIYANGAGSPTLLTQVLIFVLAATLCSLSGRAQAQLYVGDVGPYQVGEYDATTGATINADLINGGGVGGAVAVSGQILYTCGTNNTIGEYDATTGAVINANFITGLHSPSGLALSGNNLFVTNYTNGTVGKYDAATGAAINAAFITVTTPPPASLDAIAVSGNHLFVENDRGNIAEYDATTGDLINATFITEHGVGALAVQGNILYTASVVPDFGGTNTVGEYDATTGAAIHANFITGFTNLGPIAVSGNNLFVVDRSSDYQTGTVEEFDATSGAPINTSFVTGLPYVGSLAIPVPTQTVPSMPKWGWVLLPGTLLVLAGYHLRLHQPTHGRRG